MNKGGLQPRMESRNNFYSLEWDSHETGSVTQSYAHATWIPEHLYQWGKLNSERLIEKSLFVGDLSYPKPMPRMGIAFDDIELIEQIM